MDKVVRNELIKLFENWSETKFSEFHALPTSGSYRKYFRISSENSSAIGVFNSDKKENAAFIKFSEHFLKVGLPVPELYLTDLDKDIYLIQDLGNSTLYDLLSVESDNEKFNSGIITLYKKVIEKLPEFQIKANKGFNYEYCYPRPAFDKQSMMWDLNYFKYYFLKLAKIPFDEQKLEDDFNTFTGFLLQADDNNFMYRDFQSRNIMIVKDEPYFIDYQGGRKGPLQYDLASLLFDAKANLEQKIKLDLLEYYIEVVSKFKKIDRQEFLDFYYGFVLIRMLQAMGAYGFRGFYEGKTHFLKSIPFAVKNLIWFLENVKLRVKLPSLLETLSKIPQSEELKKYLIERERVNKLSVEINSFSYKNRIPVDASGNGGGFVFDCRAIFNPGRFEEYKELTGLDEPVKIFLEEKSEVGKFLENIYEIIDLSVEEYTARNFKYLMINFGCTGGQHRSVYCAEKMAEHLRKKYDIEISLNHNELKNR